MCIHNFFVEISFFELILRQKMIETMNQIIFATANRNKLEEIKAMLPASLQIKGLCEIGFTGDIPETEDTLEGNALLKARYIRERYHLACFADDTGLEVEALNNAPGVYSARYAGMTGAQEICAKANMEKLLRELSRKTNRKARFRTVIAYIDSENETHIFEGIVNGSIVETPVGKEGFGYDPVFLPNGYDVTFAQMSMHEKNLISHRAEAFRKFAETVRGI